MEVSKYTEERGAYDTAINVIGGLKDCSIIFKAVASYFSPSDSLNELINRRNEFSLRTEKSRKRIERAVQNTFLKFMSQENQDLMQGIFRENVPIQDKELALFWQLALNNRLFREITKGVYLKTYRSGRISISKDDITAYLKEFLTQKSSLKIHWSQNTIDTLSTKYLNLMSKLNFLNSGRIKSFKHITPTSEALILFLYFAKLAAPLTADILTNEFLPLSFVSQADLQGRLKKLSIKGFFDMNYNGVTLNIELIQGYKGICDVLYNRS